jgi:hypothetical protein
LHVGLRQQDCIAFDDIVEYGSKSTSTQTVGTRRIKMAMKVEIRGNKLFIEIDLETPTPSASGKTLVVASTRGNVITTAKVNEKPVIIGLNAYIKP